MPYEELLRHEDVAVHREMLAPSGAVLIRETQVFWDAPRRREALRVMVDVWDPGKVVGKTLARADFIRSPAGFVDE
jgi:hypothetical protein